jgi:serine/threonine-protein kinase RsbW
MSADTPHHLSAPADPACLDDVHALLDAAWRDAPHVGAAERARFTLIVVELVANVIEHGTDGRPIPPQLELTVDIGADAIRGVLTDNGAEPPRDALDADTPADPRRAPPAAEELATHAMRESGRGLLLIRELADELNLTRDRGRNAWHLVVRARGPG